MTPSSQKPTAGPWDVESFPIGGIEKHIIKRTYEDDQGRRCHQYIAEVLTTGGKEGETEPNATLIAEAGTVFHENGLTPRQLADQRSTLLEALETISDWRNVDLKGEHPVGLINIIHSISTRALEEVAKAKSTQS